MEINSQDFHFSSSISAITYNTKRILFAPIAFERLQNPSNSSPRRVDKQPILDCLVKYYPSFRVYLI